MSALRSLVLAVVSLAAFDAAAQEAFPGTPVGMSTRGLTGCTASAVCQLAGDASCRLTGGGSVQSTSNLDLPLWAQGTGRLILRSGSTGIGLFQDSTSTTRGSWFVAANTLTLGVNDLTAGQITFGIAGGLRMVIVGDYASSADSTFVLDVDTNLAGSYNRRFAVLGHGAVVTPRNTDNASTCAAGVVTIDPDASVWKVDANAAACAITVAKTFATAYKIDYDLVVVVTNAGAGAATMPATAGTINGPVACTTTGINGGTFSLHYSGDLDEWAILACQVKN